MGVATSLSFNKGSHALYSLLADNWAYEIYVHVAISYNKQVHNGEERNTRSKHLRDVVDNIDLNRGGHYSCHYLYCGDVLGEGIYWPVKAFKFYMEIV